VKIAIATFEFEGLTRNGGIGTAFRKLAELLARNGHSVTAIFMPFNWPHVLKKNQKSIKAEFKKLKRLKIEVIMPELEAPYFHALHDPYPVTRSFLMYKTLRSQAFDVVHACDNVGLIYFALLAKRTGLAFEKTKFVIGTHGCPVWASEANGVFSEGSTLVSQYDHLSIAMADHVVSPSRYMLEFRKRKGWPAAVRSTLIANANELTRTTGTFKKRVADAKRKSLVFFGRLERRKGIFLFARALELMLDQNPDIGADIPLDICFIGSARDSAGDLAFSQISEALVRFKKRIYIRSFVDFSSEQCLDFIQKNKNHLVCMPSLVDNLPYVIMEAIERKFDFIASKSGGQAEMIDRDDQKNVLCNPSPKDWAAKMAERLKAPRIEVRPSKNMLSANRDWLEFHKQLKREIMRSPTSSQTPSQKATPKVTIAFRGTAAPDFFASLQSILQQDFKNVEVLVPRTSFSKSIAKFFKLYDPALVNDIPAICKIARGKYILFIDAGRFETPTSLSQWVQGAERLAASAKNPKLKMLGYAAVVNRTPADHDRAIAIPLPSDPVRAIIGQCIANVYSLWLTSSLAKLSRQTPVDLSSDPNLRPFIATAIASGFNIGTVPLEAVSSLRYQSAQFWDGDHHFATLQPFLNSKSGLSENILNSLAGFHSDMSRYRTQYFRLYNMPEKSPQNSSRRR
jgi:glycosyltransferase involved in cell wall biosynthesis